MVLEEGKLCVRASTVVRLPSLRVHASRVERGRESRKKKKKGEESRGEVLFAGRRRRISGAKGDRVGLGRERRWPIKPFPSSTPPAFLCPIYEAKFRPSARPVVFVCVFVVRPSVTKLDANVSAKGKPSVNGWGRKNRGFLLASCTGPFFSVGQKRRLIRKLAGEENGRFERKTSQRQFGQRTRSRLIKFLRQRFCQQINSGLLPLLEEGSLTSNTVGT